MNTANDILSPDALLAQARAQTGSLTAQEGLAAAQEAIGSGELPSVLGDGNFC